MQNWKNFECYIVCLFMCGDVCTFEHLLDFISSVLMLFKEKKKKGFLKQLMAAVTYSVIFSQSCSEVSKQPLCLRFI